MYKSNQKACALIIIFILFILLFSFPISAESIDGYEYNGVRVTALTVNLIRGDGTLVEVVPTVTNNNNLNEVGQKEGYFIEFYNPDGLMVANEYYTIVLHLTVSPHLQTEENYVTCGYTVTTDSVQNLAIGYASGSRTGGGHTQNCSTAYKDVNFYYSNGSLSSRTSGFRYVYGAGVLGHKYTSYSSTYRIQAKKDNNYLYVFLSNVSFSVISPEQQAANSIISNDNKNTQSIINNQDENTQAIIDNDKDLYDQEKNEITQSGNQAADAKDNIPDKSEGFVDALKLFVGTMSTSETECKLKFPEIKIPAVPNLWEEKVLSEEQDVDVSGAIQLIPKTIMDLIQAVTTLGLLIYCFKELYDTISEALTRKKASSDG